MKSSNPTGCPNYAIICKGCGNIGHGLLFCRKVISLTKVGKPSSNFKGNRSRKNKDKKKRKAEESASDEDKQKIVKRLKIHGYASTYLPESHLSHSPSTPRSLNKLTLPYSLWPLRILLLLIRSINLIISVQVLIGTSPHFWITNPSNKESKRLVNMKLTKRNSRWGPFPVAMCQLKQLATLRLSGNSLIFFQCLYLYCLCWRLW